MIGFGQSGGNHRERRDELLSQATVDDILEFGLIPELVGRLPVLTTLSPLGEDDLVRILTEPKNSLIKQYEKFFEMEGAELEFTDAALHEVARIARSKETGARGLRSVVEQVMFEIMFELPDQERGKRYVITPEIVRGEERLFPHDESAAA